MKIEAFDIPGPRLLLPQKHIDARGFFAEVFRHDFFQSEVGAIEFVQDNQSCSAKAGTVRGLHFQLGPFAQAELVRVVRGAVLDVAVDLRRSSRSFGRHVATTLSAANLAALYVPIGFAHGFCTLEADSEVVYKASSYYEPEAEKGLRWNDPALNIPWPVGPNNVTISDKDRNLTLLVELGPCFT